VVSIIGCTGDWFGGWDGLKEGSAERFITEDLKRGRLVDVIERGEPAIMVCHWPGIYWNGEKKGFNIFKTVVNRLERRYDNLVWMKLSEIARYWAARELTAIQASGGKLTFHAPFGTPSFTVRTEASVSSAPTLQTGAKRSELKRVSSARRLKSGTWCREDGQVTLCFDLPRGASELRLG
jgi:hypothetical protein